jgi:hypothetical protein
MHQWQRDALKIVAEAREYASRTSDVRLHLACSRAVEVMAREGFQIPSEVSHYARMIRETFSDYERREIDR